MTHGVEGTPTIPPSYIRVRAVVWEYGERDTQADTQTAVTTIHCASATPHAKWKKSTQFTIAVANQR